MINLSYTIFAPQSLVWQALTDPNTIERWSGSSAIMTAKKGGSFKLWNGDVWGTTTKMTENKLLEQDWYSGSWDTPSNVIITLTGTQTTTEISVTQENHPENEENDLKLGWTDFYFYPLKEYVEREYKKLS